MVDTKFSDLILGHLHHVIFYAALLFISFFMREFLNFTNFDLITENSLFFGLLLVYVSGVGPYLKRKFLPHFAENPGKKVSFVLYNLAAVSLCLIIPLFIGEWLYSVLRANNLPSYFPFYILLPSPLVFLFFGREKNKVGVEKLVWNWKLILLVIFSMVIGLAATILVRPYL